MARKKEKPLIEGVRIEQLAAEGRAIAHVNECVLFVPYAAPGDVCTVQVTKKRSSYMEGRIVEITQYAPDRSIPRCKHFSLCGGCKWQHIPYARQIQAKDIQVKDALRRLGHIAVDEYETIVGYDLDNPYNYRNKLEFTFSNRKWFTNEELRQLPENASDEQLYGLGFHMPGLFDKVLNIDECHLGAPIANEVRNFVRSYCLASIEKYPFYDLRKQEGMMRTLMIRNTTLGDLMVFIAFAQDNKDSREALLNALLEQFPQITSLFYVINTKLNDSLTDLTPILYYGKEVIYEQMGPLTYRIGPKSFYQTNSKQAIRLYDKVVEFADLQPHEVVYDLYTGAGTIANYIAHSAKRVIGIEYVEEAVQDAYQNRDLNGIANTEFFAGDMKDVLNEEFIAQHGSPDVIITDPPRAGMHQDVIEVILKSAPKRIVYVSCNPATQARDLSLLTASKEYKVTRSCAVDMFPHTHHIENVALLVRRQEEHSSSPLSQQPR